MRMFKKLSLVLNKLTFHNALLFQNLARNKTLRLDCVFRVKLNSLW